MRALEAILFLCVDFFFTDELRLCRLGRAMSSKRTGSRIVLSMQGRAAVGRFICEEQRGLSPRWSPAFFPI